MQYNLTAPNVQCNRYTVWSYCLIPNTSYLLYNVILLQMIKQILQVKRKSGNDNA